MAVVPEITPVDALITSLVSVEAPLAPIARVFAVLNVTAPTCPMQDIVGVPVMRVLRRYCVGDDEVATKFAEHPNGPTCTTKLLVVPAPAV